MSKPTPAAKAPRVTLKALHAKLQDLEARYQAAPLHQAAPAPAPAPVAAPTPAPVVTPAPAPAAPAAAPAPAPAATPATNPPAPSGVKTENSAIVRHVAMMVLSVGVVGLIAWKMGGGELFNLLLMVALPVILVLGAVKVFSESTMQLLLGGQLRARVEAYMEKAHAEMNAT